MEPLQFAFHALMLRNAPAAIGIAIDLLVLFAVTAVLIAIAAGTYPRLTR